MLRVYSEDILRVYIVKHVVCSHFLLQFTRNNTLQLFRIFTEIIDQNFEIISETCFTEVFSSKLSPPKLFVTNVGRITKLKQSQ